MAITGTNVAAATGNSTTDATSFATGSWTPSANKLYLLAVAARVAGSITAPTVSGNGLTWVSVAGYDFTAAGRGLYVFRTMGSSPSTGATTIDFGAQTVASLCWSMDEFDGVDTTGTNGSGAIVQTGSAPATNSGTTITVTLSAFGSANNAAYGALGRGATQGSTPGTGFTELSDQSQATDAISLMTEWVLNDNTVDASWVTDGTYGMHAVEIKAGGGGGGGTNPFASATIRMMNYIAVR